MSTDPGQQNPSQAAKLQCRWCLASLHQLEHVAIVLHKTYLASTLLDLLPVFSKEMGTKSLSKVPLYFWGIGSTTKVQSPNAPAEWEKGWWVKFRFMQRPRSQQSTLEASGCPNAGSPKQAPRALVCRPNLQGMLISTILCALVDWHLFTIISTDSMQSDTLQAQSKKLNLCQPKQRRSGIKACRAVWEWNQTWLSKIQSRYGQSEMSKPTDQRQLPRT